MSIPAKLVKSFGYRALAAAVAMLAGCGGDGRVELQFELPTKEELSPIAGDRLAEITLIAWDADGNQTSATYPFDEPDAGIDLGRLPVGAEVTLGVELRAASSRLIGFGRSRTAVAIEADEPVVVPISVRRPFVYVPGGGVDLFGTITPTLATFDSTLDPGTETTADYKGAISADMTATASAATSDGRELVVVGQNSSGGLLRLLSTSSHEPGDVEGVAIAANPVDVAVTPDSSYAIVGHEGADGGVSVIDLERLRAGASDAVTFAPLGSVGAVAASGDRITGSGYALIDRAPRRVDLTSLDVDVLRAFRTNRVSCTPPPSSLVIVPLADPIERGIDHALGGPVQDIAVSADGSTIAIADACNDAVRTVNPTTGALTDLAALQDATTVAIHGGRLHAAGTAVDDGASTIQILSIDIDGGSPARVTLPTRQERSVLLDLSQPGQSTEIAVDADAVIAYELAVAPDSAHVALLVEGYHHADAVSNLPELEIDSYEYLLVNLSSGAQVHRVRNYCLVKQLSGTPFELECAVTPEQDAIPNEGMYIPLSLSVLYGDR